MQIRLTHWSGSCLGLIVAILIELCCGSVSLAQRGVPVPPRRADFVKSQPPPVVEGANALSLAEPAISGLRSWLTDRWGTLQVTVSNAGTEARDARVVVFFVNQPGIQFARDVRVPGRSTITTWLLIGPAPSQLVAKMGLPMRDSTGQPLAPQMAESDLPEKSRFSFMTERGAKID